MAARALLCLLPLLGAGCTERLCSGKELERAKTPAEEAKAMQRLWSACRPLSLSARAADGAAVSTSDPGWARQVSVLQITAGKNRFEHRVIDGENAKLLLRE